MNSESRGLEIIHQQSAPLLHRERHHILYRNFGKSRSDSPESLRGSDTGIRFHYRSPISGKVKVYRGQFLSHSACHTRPVEDEERTIGAKTQGRRKKLFLA